MSYYQSDDGHCAIQAVLPNEAEMPKLRIPSQDTAVVSVQSLPYTLDTE